MVKKLTVAVVVLAAIFMMAGISMAQETEVVETAVTVTTTETVAPVVVGNKVCPVTGLAIAEADMGANTVEFEGKVYNLCCGDCKEKFLADPKAAVAKVEAGMAVEAAAAEAK